MIYLVRRNGFTGYDEYSAFVVRAKSKKEALKIVGDRLTDRPGLPSSKKKPLVKVIKSAGKSGEILGSFNAG